MLRGPPCPRKTRIRYIILAARVVTEIHLNSVASPTTMGRPTYTRQQVGSSTFTNSFVVNVPGIWVIQVGKPSAGQTDVAFVVDQDTASYVHRWATHKQGFE